MEIKIAHPSSSGGPHQTVKEHLLEVSNLAALFAKKINMEQAGALIGLLHDFGKYSSDFQRYIHSAAGLINPDADNYIDFKANKGRIDHSTAGAQWIYKNIDLNRVKKMYDQPNKEAVMVLVLVEILSICIASHHSGLIDCLPNDIKGAGGLSSRMEKAENKTHYLECIDSSDEIILNKAQELSTDTVFKSLAKQLVKITEPQQNGFEISELTQAFNLTMQAKFMFSCLIDADRISSADYETPQNKTHRASLLPNWQLACESMERFINEFPVCLPIDYIRQGISEHCYKRAQDQQGIFSLTVPTGGGKTYSSLRFALHHASFHQLERIIYIIPFTSIIDQNAQAIRNVFDKHEELKDWVYEHHSNLEPEQQTWRSKLVAENWDAPIVLTTMAQFLESLFSDGTRGVRRLHQLARSVLVFDEIQTLPINCVHLFNNAINYLSSHCQTTALMCTATQPLLNQLDKPENGQLHLSLDNELMPDIRSDFKRLKRVEIVDKTKDCGWELSEVANFALENIRLKGTCLIIVNTKDWARTLFKECRDKLRYENIEQLEIFHLSTGQCPAHRKALLEKVKSRLKSNLPTLCISTQLIEAGVDISFATVIRFIAGLDSIAQAAGRCNRSGEDELSQVYIVNPKEEKIDLLVDMKLGQQVTTRILNEGKKQGSCFDLLSPDVMNKYFKYYFYARSDDMSYRLQSDKNNSVLKLLSKNGCSVEAGKTMRQAFKSAGQEFKAIDAPTHALIVPYGETGKALLAELCSLSKHFEIGKYKQVLKALQQYSINVFPNVWNRLIANNAIVELVDDKNQRDGMFYLKSEFYSDEFGLCENKVVMTESFVF